MSDRALVTRVNGLVVAALKDVDFAFKLEERGKQYSFNRIFIAAVRHRVDADVIQVQNNPQRLQRANATAGYDYLDDTVYVDVSKLGDKNAGPAVVHEYTHAGCDVFKYPFTQGTNEGVAFLVERLCMGFGTHIDHKADPDMQGDPLAITVFEEAEKLMISKKLATDRAAEISAAEFKSLRDAVVALYVASSYPPFQADQMVDHLGMTRPYP